MSGVSDMILACIIWFLWIKMTARYRDCTIFSGVLSSYITIRNSKDTTPCCLCYQYQFGTLHIHVMDCRLLDPRSSASMLAYFSQPFEKSNLSKDCKISHSRKIFGKRHLQDYLIYFQTGISRKIQQLPCKKMHLSVKWQSFCVDPNRLLVSSDWVWDKIDAMFQTALWKKIQKLYKRKSVWKCQ